jgi:hypothetical protein
MRPVVKASLFCALCLLLAGIGLAMAWTPTPQVRFVVIGTGSQAMTLELSRPIDPSGFGIMDVRAEAFHSLERMTAAQMKAGTFDPARASWATTALLNSAWQCQGDSRMVMAPCGPRCYYAVGCMSGGNGGGCCGVAVPSVQ